MKNKAHMLVSPSKIGLLLALFCYSFSSVATEDAAPAEGAAAEVTSEASAAAPTWHRIEPTPEERKAATENVKQELLKPETAEFGELWFVDNTDGKRIICGYVNAMDVHGQLTGKQMFYLTDKNNLFMENSGAGGFYAPEDLMGICSP